MNLVRFDLTEICIGLPNLTTIIPRNVVEIGSRDGYDANFIADHFKIDHKYCYVFEPNPTQCQEILSAYPNFNTFNNAISQMNGTFPFWIDKNNVGASSLLEKNGANLEKIEVDCIDMKSVIEKLPLTYIDICKIDVEGATLDVLKSFYEKLDIVKSFQIESETDVVWKGQTLYSDIKPYLEQRGFLEIMKIHVSCLQIDSLWVKKEFINQ